MNIKRNLSKKLTGGDEGELAGIEEENQSQSSSLFEERKEAGREKRIAGYIKKL